MRGALARVLRCAGARRRVHVRLQKMASRLRGGAALGLRDFIHRSRVLSQYRMFMRELVGIEAGTAAELRAQIREAFEKNRDEKNLANRKAALAEGTRQLQFLRTYVGTARRAQEAAGMAPGESWVGSGETWDVRGRIGEGWAWSPSSTPSDSPPAAVEEEEVVRGVGRVTTKEPQ